MSNIKKDRVGEEGVNNQGLPFTIIAYTNAFNCDVQFNNCMTIVTSVSYSEVKRKSVKNPNYPIVYGVGYVGQGKYLPKTHLKIYKTWNGVLERCYSDRFHKTQPTYIGCLTTKEWHNFQVFGDWFEENYKEGFELDKDILLKGNKLYSPETCCFVPKEINTIITKRQNHRGEYPIGVRKRDNKFEARFNKGKNNPIYLGLFNTLEEAFYAYKSAKEIWIKEIADTYRGQITEACYEALYRYEIERTD